MDIIRDAETDGHAAVAAAANAEARDRRIVRPTGVVADGEVVRAVRGELLAPRGFPSATTISGAEGAAVHSLSGGTKRKIEGAQPEQSGGKTQPAC